MDAARASATVAALGLPCMDWATALRAARQLKNDVVGNRISKGIYVSVGAAPALLAVVRSSSAPPALVTEALSATASLAVRCTSGVSALLAAGAIDALVASLSASVESVVHAAARALRVLAQAPATPPAVLDSVAGSSSAVARLVALATPAGPVCADCAAILACAVRTPEHAVTARAAGALPVLLVQLAPTSHPARTAAAVDALAAIALADQSAAAEIAAAGAPRAALPLVRVAEPALRLAACRLLARLRLAFKDERTQAEVADVVVPELVRLLGAESREVRIAAPRVLAEMVEGDRDMQKRATEAGAIAKLAAFFPRTDDAAEGRALGKKRFVARPGMNGKGQLVRGIEVDKKKECMPAAESAMIGMAALCAKLDDAREKVVKEGLLSHVVAYLGEQSPSVVLAAARCFRSLTHGVKVVRRDLAVRDVPGDVADLLLRLLDVEDIETRRVVSAAICNIVLEFSPVQPVFLERGGIAAIVRLLQNDDQELRKNALWAIKNLLFKADLEVKNQVMAALSYDSLCEICASPCPLLREQALTVVRNLACVGSVRSEIEHLDLLFARMGDRLLAVLESALSPSEETNPKIAVQALYTVSNIASGAERHKMRLIDSEIPRRILSWISHPEDQARISAVWCVINLSRHDRPPPPRRRSSAAIRLPSRPRPSRLAQLAAAHLPLPRTPEARAVLEAPTTPSPRSPQTAVRSEDDDDEPQSMLNHYDEDDMDDTDRHDDAGPDEMVVDSDRDTSEAASQDSPMVDTPRTPPPPASACTAEPSPPAPRTPEPREGFEYRIGRLRALGFEGKLRLLATDQHVEVQGRARAALEQFSAADITTLDYLPSSLLTRLNPPQPGRSRMHGSPGMRIARIPQTAHNNVSDDSSAGSFSEGSTLTAAVEAMDRRVEAMDRRVAELE